jgi:hypothetical protein
MELVSLNPAYGLIIACLLCSSESISFWTAAALAAAALSASLAELIPIMPDITLDPAPTNPAINSGPILLFLKVYIYH